jgi:hypothetical protein
MEVSVVAGPQRVPLSAPGRPEMADDVSVRIEDADLRYRSDLQTLLPPRFA